VIPLRLVETEREGFEEPVVELWRDDEFVGFVFWDEGSIVQIFHDRDDDVFDLDLHDLLRVLDLADRMVAPGFGDFAVLQDAIRSGEAAYEASDGEAEDEDWEDEDPAVVALAEEFDEQAAHRNDDSEGYFDTATARRLIDACDRLDLAIVEMDGFDLEGAALIPRPNLTLEVADGGGAEWSDYRRLSNDAARGTLVGWPGRPSLVVAFVIKRHDGERIVM
jgi:hypothetical protein